MPTTVHIPDPLLKSVDRRTKALGISRTFGFFSRSAADR